MKAPSETYVGPSKTIAMRVSPGVVVQIIVGDVTWNHLHDALPILERPIVGARYVQICRVAPVTIKDIPNDEFRKRAAESLKKQAGRLVALAYVVVGEGFLASMARTVIAGVGLLSRTTHAEKVFPEPLEAATWLATQMPAGAVVPTEVVAALDELVALTSSSS